MKMLVTKNNIIEKESLRRHNELVEECDDLSDKANFYANKEIKNNKLHKELYSDCNEVADENKALMKQIQ